MGQQVQDSQIAIYRRRMQREAPACRLRSLFEQNDVVNQVFSVVVVDGVELSSGDNLHAIVDADNPERFVVINLDGRQVGMIAGENGRVLALMLSENQLTTVKIGVEDILPVCGDAQVKILSE
ncbi:MAG: hypothetical protein U0744_08760 [Gemmataceae bacterium]